MSSWQIIEGDSVAIVRTLPAESRRVIVCDPPYGKGHYKTDKDVCVAALLPVVAEARTVALKGYPINVHQWLPALGLTPEEWIAWYPTNYAAKAGGRWKGLPKWHEDIVVCGAVPGAKRLKQERVRAGISASKKHAGKNWDPASGSAIGDVWTDAAPGIGFLSERRLHANESPVSLMLKLVELCSNPGDTILDPFAGSASLGVACLRLGRHYIGIEVFPEWAALCRERLAAEEAGSTMEASRAGQLPLLGGAGWRREG